MARQTATSQVVAIEPDEFLCGPVDSSTGSADTVFEHGSSDPVTEVLMVDSRHNPPGFRRNGGNGDGDGPSYDDDGPSYDHDEYESQPLNS